MKSQQIVCLANSYKHNHRCMAGISLADKIWVRLIGKDVHGGLTREQTCYQDGMEISVLDVFEAELGEKCGSNSHPEDVYVTENKLRPIRRFDGQRDIRLLADYLTKGPAVLQGYGDRVYLRKFEGAAADRSLELIEPNDLWWWIRDEGGKRKNRALFRSGHVGRTRYDLPVTDPAWLNQLHLLPAGIYPHAFFFESKPPRTLLTMSLSEPFEGFHYKLVAGVVALPG
jgi:hypothetical protein